ncbi:protein unzipped [Venturia canescens]|uniref:protein unzipped n=1 Tax=Venturia canescens TaxID=32260 RepID=UPI001C9C597D|nr:protein unzipped [Venturia canescens]
MARMAKILRSLSLIGVLVALEISSIHADNSVYILSKYRQRVTSSTLNWLAIAHYEASSKEIVIGGFEIQRELDGNQAESPVVKERSLYVCRAFHSGVWVAGKQIEGEKKCTVTYLGNVVSYERYDLLENVDNAARLSWVAWDKLHQTPVGAVATESMYVARHVVSETENERTNKNLGYTHYIGTYDTSEGFGRINYVKDDGVEGTAESGEVLVETEPIFYELNAVKLNYNRKRILKRVTRVLRETTISNADSESAVLAEALGYTFNHSIYWGQGHATIKALNTSITLAKGPRVGYISWGIEDKSVRSNATTVKIRLEPGTAVNVTLRANYTDMEVPYTGELVSVYEDGERRSRMIGGMCREETMMDLKYEFGPIYYLSNMSIVPTTLPPPSTEAMLPTTTMKKTTKEPEYTSVQEETYGPNEQTPEVDENLIVPPRKTDTSNMQNDDGGPLSLKNKVEGSQSSSTSLSSSTSALALITLTIIAFHRIT